MGRSDILRALLVFATAFALYWPVRKFQWVEFDDPLYVFGNQHVLTGLSWRGVAWACTANIGGNWQPLTMLSHMLDIQLFGARAGPMHLENVLIHACAGTGWYLLLRAMTGRIWPSCMVSLFFAVHPAHVESVAWISERKDTLSMLLLVASLFAYWQYTKASGIFAYFTSFLLFCLGLTAKVMIVTQPLLMLLLDVWPLHRTGLLPIQSHIADRKQLAPISLSRLLVEKLPFFAAAAVMSVIALHMQTKVRTTAGLTILPLSHRIDNATFGYVRYLQMAFWPHDLAIYYPYRWNIPQGAVASSVILLLIISIVAFRASARRPYVLVGWIWFVGTLVPVIGLVQVGRQAIADRYTYLPFVGLSIAAVWFIADSIERVKDPRGRRMARVVAIIAALMATAGFAVQSANYLPYWADTVSLFTKAEVVNGSPDGIIESHLADGYVDAGRPDLAMDHYAMAIEAAPNQVGAHINMGNLLIRYSPLLALEHYRAAERCDPLDATAHVDCGVCLIALNRNSEAISELRRALQIDPDLIQAKQEIERLHLPP